MLFSISRMLNFQNKVHSESVCHLSSFRLLTLVSFWGVWPLTPVNSDLDTETPAKFLYQTEEEKEEKTRLWYAHS